MEVTSTEAPVKASVIAELLPPKLSYFHGIVRESFHGSVRESFHGIFRGSFRQADVP